MYNNKTAVNTKINAKTI